MRSLPAVKPPIHKVWEKRNAMTKTNNNGMAQIQNKSAS